MNEAHKRQYVYDLYSGPKWKKRVRNMSDDQVTALYLKHQNEGEMPEHDEVVEPGPPEPEQEKLNIPGDPHANEDQFEIY